MKKILLYHFLFFFSITFSQNQKYVRVNNSGDSIFYTVNRISKTFKSINNKGKLINKGRISGLSGFNDDDQFFSGGEFDIYPQKDYNFPDGFPIYSVLYKMINSKLNGIHYVGGFETVNNKREYNPYKNFLAIIDNNIVASNIQRRKEDKEAKFVLEYDNWKRISLEINDFFIFTSPEIHNEEKLYYNLELMVNIFLDDFKSFLDEASRNIDIAKIGHPNKANFNQVKVQLNSLKSQLENNSTNSIFEELEGETIALSQGLDYDSDIYIKVDPAKWINSSPAKRWYILYHELGHDVLNLRHGQGGRMMFNYPTKNYTWKDFFNDRHEMFMFYLNKNYPGNEIFFPMNLNN